MAEKYPQEVQGYPLAPATVVPRSDEEYGRNYQSEQEMKKKKRMKCFAYIAVFAVFQVAVILLFSLTVMRVKTPKVRLGDIQVTGGGGGDVKLSARVLVKNTNFGRYKFDSSLATIRSGNNSSVGQFVIPEARARARSTKKIAIVADLSSGNSESLELIVEAELRGKVELMKLIKKKKSARMNCSITLVLSTATVQNLSCK